MYTVCATQHNLIVWVGAFVFFPNYTLCWRTHVYYLTLLARQHELVVN